MELRGRKRPAVIGSLLVGAFLVGWLTVGWVLPSLTRPVSEGSTIDGWKLGALATECMGNDQCSVLLPVARTRLDQRDPGHAAVVASELRLQESDQVRTSIMYVAVFTLADGSHKALGVLFPGVSRTPMTFDYGP